MHWYSAGKGFISMPICSELTKVDCKVWESSCSFLFWRLICQLKARKSILDGPTNLFHRDSGSIGFGPCEVLAKTNAAADITLEYSMFR